MTQSASSFRLDLVLPELIAETTVSEGLLAGKATSYLRGATTTRKKVAVGPGER